FLGITARGMTFVILSGGSDLSIGAVLAFTTILVATLVSNQHWHPVAAIAVALALGTGFGFGMGFLIERYKLPPFLVTLGGMFFARGMAFVVNTESVRISHGFYDAIQSFHLNLGGGARLGSTALIFIALVVLAIVLAH